MPDSVLVSVAGDVASAGAALAGLVLVFLGHTAGTFENYNPKDRLTQPLSNSEAVLGHVP